MERRDHLEHDALRLPRLDGEDAQLEGLAVLPLEERRVEHLIDDLLVGLASLVALDELAVHELAVDLHGEPGEHRAVGERKAERALEALVALVHELVLDGHLGDVAGGDGGDGEALERELRLAGLLAVRLQRALADERGVHGGGQRRAAQRDGGQYAGRSRRWVRADPSCAAGRAAHKNRQYQNTM